MDDFEESGSPQRLKPSLIPSWVMLGFILGALCVWALPHPKESGPPPAPVEIRAAPVAPAPRHSDIEALFSEWGRYAVWADDKTYICTWDPTTQTFANCFEVLRRGDVLYFRTIERPRNLRVIEGVPDKSPLEFLNPVPDRTLRWERPSPPEQPPPEKPAAVVQPQTPPEKIPVEINPPKP